MPARTKLSVEHRRNRIALSTDVDHDGSFDGHGATGAVAAEHSLRVGGEHVGISTRRERVSELHTANLTRLRDEAHCEGHSELDIERTRTSHESAAIRDAVRAGSTVVAVYPPRARCTTMPC